MRIQPRRPFSILGGSVQDLTWALSILSLLWSLWQSRTIRSLNDTSFLVASLWSRTPRTHGFCFRRSLCACRTVHQWWVSLVHSICIEWVSSRNIPNDPSLKCAHSQNPDNTHIVPTHIKILLNYWLLSKAFIINLTIITYNVVKLVVMRVLLALLDHFVAFVAFISHPATLGLMNAQLCYLYRFLAVEAWLFLDGG